MYTGFESNAAVYQEAHYLEISGTAVEYIGMLSVAVPGIGDVSGALLGAWGKVLSDHNHNVAEALLRYNRRHKHSYIYMDYNFNGNYSFHTFK
ncbi:hypothetical protein [Lactobacillus sp. PV012]|uniref:hypothetical protein n=1 Tax=Lactobacillus sp. PV012 TaxID=2594494 RepID=UPI002240DF80|nr:hypothetical protein [Lactobacillus sp. PV012]QNQ81569.1 hypothetical protein FP433_00140 [Lactobacillus sp. PV012]